MIRVEFEESDFELFRKLFSNEDSAAAALRIVSSAPPEIQVIMYQLMILIRKFMSEEEVK